MRCNLCHGESFARLPFHYSWAGKRWQGRRCRSCGLICIDPQPSEDELARLYAADYFADGLHGLDRAGLDYEALHDADRTAASRLVETVLRRHHPAAERLFEIGPAMGHVLDAARRAGLDVGGVEISPTGVARAREKFGLDLIEGNIEFVDLSAENGGWDIVYCGDLLEHVRDPLGVVGKAAALLRPGGLCVMRLPGTFNLLATRLAVPLLLALGRQKQLPDKPYHLYEFTTTTARRLFARHFDRVEVRNEAIAPWRLNRKTGSADYLAKYLLQWLNWPLTGLTNRFGDRMTILAYRD